MTKQLTVAPHIRDIIRRLSEAGFEAYIVGGAIRDLMLERTPKDYDISTSARPEQVKEVFGRKRTMIIGKRFRLVHLYHGSEIIEISTFRQAPEETGRITDKAFQKPAPENMIFRDNEYGTAEEDAWRRDFTVNALFYNPLTDQIIDHTGHGIEDMNNGVVRAIGNAALRFEEDPVRLLRALKLVGQYSFRMSEETEEALFRQMPLIIHASPSRLTLEMEKIMKGVYGHAILPAFQRYGLLKYFLPYLHENWKTPAAEYAMRLLEGRNRRVVSGKFRDSISVAMATVALPFIERHCGCEYGSLWPYEPRTLGIIYQVLHEIFQPHHLIKRLSISADRMLQLQTALVNSSKISKITSLQGYTHARELMMIQNTVEWHSPTLEAMWPTEAAIEPNQKKYKKGRFRRR
jgi:poly(A) polymerase